jgi:beta-1,4-mannosyl-glycoprotein beta-1,4-N-acetylglucosaminyltransferase
VAVWDCFTFFNEVLLLEVRLRELEDVVDHFVLVESPLTHQGQEKPLTFHEERARYSRWSDRIIHVVAELPQTADSAWVRETGQRASILDGLADAKANDIVIVSDLDEVPRASVVHQLDTTLDAPSTLDLGLYLYKFNLQIAKHWPLAKAARFSDLKDANSLRQNYELPVVIRYFLIGPAPSR